MTIKHLQLLGWPCLVTAQVSAALSASRPIRLLAHLQGDEIVHALLNFMAAAASCRVVRRAVHIQPSVSEHVPTLLGGPLPLPP